MALDGDRTVIGRPFSNQADTWSGSAHVSDLTGGLLTSAGGFGTAQATFNLIEGALH
ncbi:MAG: hypothetical protein ACJAQ3_002051 [Planctomycetota bacterium]